jgi:hypothetical protein
MSGWPVWAWSLERLAQPQTVLAIVGGAALGGLLTGFVVRMIVKATTAQNMPRGLQNLFRVLGGVIAGWVVALFVLGTGGGGAGEGPGEKDKGTFVSKDTPAQKDQTRGPERRGTLSVEVLNNEEIQAALGEQALDSGRYYRIKGTDSKDLLTLDEVKDKIKEEKPPLKRLNVVTGPGRPGRQVPRVNELASWADKQGIEVAYTAPE